MWSLPKEHAFFSTGPVPRTSCIVRGTVSGYSFLPGIRTKSGRTLTSLHVHIDVTYPGPSGREFRKQAWCQFMRWNIQKHQGRYLLR